MRFEIDIDYPYEKMEQSKLRMEARRQFRIVDRVPINYCVVARYFAPIFGLRYLDFFKDAETQFYWLLQFAKFQLENIPCDLVTEPVISVHPFFDNAIPPSAHGAEIGWVEEEPLRALPVIHTLEQMEAYQPAAPDAGLRGTAIAWWLQMRDLAAQTRLTFNGKQGRVDVAALSLVGLSPHMLAIDLIGENFYWWMLEYPAACHRFLDKVTQAEIAAEENTRRIDPRPRGDIYGIAEDSAQCMSPKLFKEFCAPYANRLFERYGKKGRHVHMCGASAHLHRVLKEDMGMTGFDIFGYLVPPKVAAQNLGGTTLLWGNLNPMLMKDGAPAEVKAAARECLEAMAPCGGFMLGDGANVCPGTPPQSFTAILDAAEEYGTGR
jgi:uroporphyrinogen-III decarboxylase